VGGGEPLADLIQGTDGNLYGTTSVGGDINCLDPGVGCGTIFQVTPTDQWNTLHTFKLHDGSTPTSALLQATSGIFYGLTENGGKVVGTVFSLDMGLGPFVAFVEHAGEVGQTIGVLGQGFIGSSNVTFSGKTASFTVVSDTFINATVPAGATTGYVTVTTPSGTLTSNVPFHVIP
jgi:uncharacterized repeat protein (TIGR03803 family)